MNDKSKDSQNTNLNLSKSYNIGDVNNGTVFQGENNSISSSDISSNSPDGVWEVKTILNSLSEEYHNHPDWKKREIFQAEIQSKIKNNLPLKKRFLGAAKTGSIELIKVLTNNPFVSVPVETFRGWLKP